MTNIIVYVHKQLGYWSTNYLDDFGSAELPKDAINSFNAMTCILESTGICEAPEKAVWPCTHMDFLGNMVDSERMMIEVSITRKQELLELISEWKCKKIIHH